MCDGKGTSARVATTVPLSLDSDGHQAIAWFFIGYHQAAAWFYLIAHQAVAWFISIEHQALAWFYMHLHPCHGLVF